MDLAIGQQWIDNRAGVVHCHVAHDMDSAGFGVDLDDRDVGPERKCLTSGPVVVPRPQSGFVSRGQTLACMSGLCNLLEGKAATGHAGYREDSVAPLDVCFGDF